jgi:two-component system LytT family response regulator
MSTTIPLLKVLVVSEHRDMCESWKNFIDMAPRLSCPAYALDGESALANTERLKPHVIFMDTYLPDIDGFTVTQQILSHFPETVIILHSSDKKTEQQTYDSGAVGFMLLPITPEKLIATIRRVYGEQRG